MNYPKTMKALLCYGKNNYRFEAAFPSPDCGDDDIIIKVEGCGICAGDLKCFHGIEAFWGDGTAPGYAEPPFIPGHEFLGRIVEIGKNVKNFRKGLAEGDRIIADQIVPCGECRFCKTGRYWMCQPHRVFGFKGNWNGGMAEYVRYPKNAIVHKVPEDMPLRDALLIEPFSCSKHAIDRAEIQCEDIVVISGAGTLGLGMVTNAVLKNPKALISLDMMDKRLEKALELGATHAFNPSKTDVKKIIMDMTEGYGCDIYIEATGHPSSVNQGLSLIRKLGRFVEFSVFGEKATVDWTLIGDTKELDIHGVSLSPYCFPFVIENISGGKLKTGGIVENIFPLEEWEKAFDHASGKYGDYKVAFAP
ncbi:MAG: alcohol dehydrogenase catalytic domain-containing protein [Treponema sp.]|jgi:L-iditol 2-dehydrogenase|nr:alcohol dehydrogenase catalytic domain-containing protein [Treponema sp.]